MMSIMASIDSVALGMCSTGSMFSVFRSSRKMAV